MSLTAGIFGEFKTGDYTVTRYTTASPAYDANGKAVASATSTFVVAGSVRPVSGRELQQVKGVQHGAEHRKMYVAATGADGSPVVLRSRSETTDPDTVVVDGEVWEVVAAAHFGVFDGGHWRAIIARRVVTA